MTVTEKSLIIPGTEYEGDSIEKNNCFYLRIHGSYKCPEYRRMKKYGRILVVDDDQKSRNILERLLAPTDYEVEIVKSGEEAVKRLKRSKFNLVLTDLDMPDMD